MLSVVVPVYNEADSLRTLFDEIDAVSRSLESPLEIVFVDDGSTDASWTVIQKLADSGEHKQAEKAAHRIVKKYKNTSVHEDAIFLRGDAQFQQQNYVVPHHQDH